MSEWRISAMHRYQSYQFRLRPSRNQLSQIRRIAGCCRFVFNQALAIQIQHREQGKAELDPYFEKAGSVRELSVLRAE